MTCERAVKLGWCGVTAVPGRVRGKEMSKFVWRASAGDHVISAGAADIAHTIAGLRHALEGFAETADAPEVEGSVTDPEGDSLPFWIGWGSLAPASPVDSGRDVRLARAQVLWLVEGLRCELHRVADNRVVGHPITG